MFVRFAALIKFAGSQAEPSTRWPTEPFAVTTLGWVCPTASGFSTAQTPPTSWTSFAANLAS